MSSYSWVEGAPNRPREIAVEKQMGVVLNCPTAQWLSMWLEYIAALLAMARARRMSLQVKALMIGGRDLDFQARLRI